MKKKWLLFSMLSLLAIPTALADLGDTLGNVWWKIMSVGNLSFLGMSDGSVVVALTRILIGILVFTIFYAVINMLSGGDKPTLPFIKKNQAMVIAAIIAIITSIFLPAHVLLAVGTGWATLVALLLIGGPIVGIAFLMWTYPGKDSEGNSKETKATVVLKIVLCILLLWILEAMRYHVGRMI
jgi:hypothetical protein